MSRFPQVLKHLMASGPLSPQQQDLVLDVLPSVPDPDDVLTALTQHTPAESWTLRTARALHRCQSSTLRGEGWYRTGMARLPFTTSEWEAAALAENNRHVRRELLTIAPRDASREAIAALVDATTLDIDPAKAADEEELENFRTWFAYDLLEHMPAHAGWACAELLQYADPTLSDITKANAALRHCDPLAGATDPRVPALWRIRLAAHASIPAGVMTSVVTDLRANRAALDALSNALTAGTHLRTAFHEMLDVPFGTGEDRAALLEFMTASDVIGVHPMKDQLAHHDELLDRERHGTPADVVLCALTTSPSVVHRPARVRALWERLPVEQRTDKVCVQVVKASEDMGHDVVAHLGTRASGVLEVAGLFEYEVGRDRAATWLRDLDRDRWIHEVRKDVTENRLATLLSIPENQGADDDEFGAYDESVPPAGGANWQVLASRHAIVEDLKADYLSWPSASAVRVLQHLGADQLDDLFTHIPVTTIALWASTGSPEAAQALWKGLEEAVRADPDVNADVDAPAEANGSVGSVPVDQSRAAAVAALLCGTVTLPDLKVAQHL